MTEPGFFDPEHPRFSRPCPDTANPCGQLHDCSGHAYDWDEEELGVAIGPRRPCRKARMANQFVCSRHGGKAPQAIAAAQRRGAAAADSAIAALEHIIEDPATPLINRLRAIKQLTDLVIPKPEQQPFDLREAVRARPEILVELLDMVEADPSILEGVE